MNSSTSSPSFFFSKRTLSALALAFFVLAATLLRAQNTSTLDTAPGVNAAPVAPAAAAPAPPAAPSLLENGDFQKATSDPTFPDGWGKAKGITWESENGTHFLRLVSQQPGQMLMEYHEMPIPEGVKALEISVRYRTAGVKKGVNSWYDCRSIFHFIDSGRKNLSPDPKPMVFSDRAANWTEASERVLVPANADKLVLMPSLFQAAAGTLDLAEIRVSALDDTAATSMSSAEAAKAKKEADQAAILKQEEAMPSKSQQLKVSGNRLVTADGKDMWLQGVNVCSLEWAPEGNNPLWSIHIAIDDWKANVIRLPVMDSFWFGHGKGGSPANDPEAYRAIIDNAVKIAAGKGAYIVLDLHRYLTPDADCAAFWKDAAARYKNNPAVLFDLFNEPHDTTWEVWRNGGPTVTKEKDGTSKTIQGVGMQGLVDAVRGTGAKNIIVAGGLGYAYDLTGVVKGFALDDKGGNGIMYATHFYNWHKDWAGHFMAVAAKYPVLVGECGADIHKMGFIPSADQEDPYTWAPDAIGFIQKNHLNWTAWSFHTSATPDLLADWDYTPTPFWGAFVKDALGGKQFEMKKER